MNGRHIREALLDQRAERDRILGSGSIIERESLNYWRQHLGTDIIKVATGVRRAGKTVFSHLLLRGRNAAFVNFDDERLAFLRKDQLNMVLEALYEEYGEFEYLLLDEVQNIEGWELLVSRLQRKGVNVLVTGSNARLLSREFSTYLTGRHLIMEMYPFSFREYLMWEGVGIKRLDTPSRAALKSALRGYLKIGGFPEVVRNPDMCDTYLSSLYSSVISRDIIGRHRIRFERTFREIGLAVMSNFSRMVSYNKLKNTYGLKSVHTAKNYLSYLEEAYLVLTVRKYSPKPKEVVNSPRKIYAVDTGLARAVSLASSENAGLLMENAVLLDLLRRKALMPGMGIFYWRDHAGRETDFLVKAGTDIVGLIQVTHASGRDEIDRREIRGILKAAEATGCSEMTVITWDYEDVLEFDGKNIRAVPLWKWLYLNDPGGSKPEQ